MSNITPDCLDAVTTCLIGLARIEPQAPAEWLRQAAACVRKSIAESIAEDAIVTLVDWPQHRERCRPATSGMAVPERSMERAWKTHFFDAAQGASELLQDRYDGAETVLCGREACPRPGPGAEPVDGVLKYFVPSLKVDAIAHAMGVVDGLGSSSKRFLWLAIWSPSTLEGTQAKDAAWPIDGALGAVWRATMSHYAECLRSTIASHELLMERLTPTQRSVAERLLQGRNEQQIAKELDRSHHTVHDHVKAIYKAWGVRSRGEFMARWVEADC